MKSATKLVIKHQNGSQFTTQKRGYANVHKTKKAIQSESKKNSTIGINQFNDISEIQEFNVTDEESLINSSILKNIEDHESLHDGMHPESTRKTKLSNGKKSSHSKKKNKKTGKKVKKMNFISSARKSGKKKKSQQDGDKKNTNKRKVVFHISKPSNIEAHDEEDSLGDGYQEGQIKKVDASFNNNKDESENDTINIEDISPNKNLMQGMKKLEKIEMIGSDKLSELLSSKKKHRYKPVQDSMDGVIDENVGQHINFTQEEANLHFNDYDSQNDSLRDHSLEGYQHDIDNLEEDKQS